MPSRNAIKLYRSNAYYHVYNRGVEKRLTYLDHCDFSHFLYLLELRLTPPAPAARIANYYGRITLAAYCLMPNHFHLLIHQRHSADMSSFMRSVMSAYVRYFNRRYDRVGSLFQDKYKAVLLPLPGDVERVMRYIHENPGPGMETYPYSSFRLH